MRNGVIAMPDEVDFGYQRYPEARHLYAERTKTQHTTHNTHTTYTQHATHHTTHNMEGTKHYVQHTHTPLTAHTALTTHVTYTTHTVTTRKHSTLMPNIG